MVTPPEILSRERHGQKKRKLEKYGKEISAVELTRLLYQLAWLIFN